MGRKPSPAHTLHFLLFEPRFAEEYAIHDFEGYGSYRLGEYEGLESAHEIACFIEEHGELAPSC